MTGPVTGAAPGGDATGQPRAQYRGRAAGKHRRGGLDRSRLAW